MFDAAHYVRIFMDRSKSDIQVTVSNMLMHGTV